MMLCFIISNSTCSILATLTFDQGAMVIQWEKVFLTSGAGTIGHLYVKTNK